MEWDQESGDGAKKLEASVGFNFADYLFNNDFVKTTNFTVRPLYAHKWTNQRGEKRKGSEVLGLNLESNFEFPYGFELEFKLEPTYTSYGTKQTIFKDKKGEDLREKKRALDMDVTLTLSNSVNLYTQDKFALDFNFEGGYDAYKFHQYRSYDEDKKKVGAKRSYSLYALPTLEASYQATEFVKLYAAAGAEYRNWKVKDEDSATRWRWQPTAWAGMKVNF